MIYDSGTVIYIYLHKEQQCDNTFRFELRQDATKN